MTLMSRIATLALAATTSLLVVTQVHARSDASFLKEAAEAGGAEVEASKLAQSKAQRADVKAFAGTMVTEHSQLADELKQLAAAKKVELPSGPTLVQKSKLKLIDSGDDAKFDERYVKSFGVKAHEDTIKLFEEASRDAKDPEVKAFAQKALPSLQHHLDMARALTTK